MKVPPTGKLFNVRAAFQPTHVQAVARVTPCGTGVAAIVVRVKGFPWAAVVADDAQKLLRTIEEESNLWQSN